MKKPARKANRITLRLASAIAADLQAAAEAAGMSIAAWAREALAQAARDARRADELAALRGELAELVAELRTDVTVQREDVDTKLKLISDQLDALTRFVVGGKPR